MLSGWVEFETAKAVLFHSDFMEQEEGIWLPLSQVLDQEVTDADLNRREIVVKYWLIQKNGYQ
jgi:hypothetical protein